MYNINIKIIKHAAVLELGDNADLKSAGSNTVPVRIRSAAPKEIVTENPPVNNPGISDFDKFYSVNGLFVGV